MKILSVELKNYRNYKNIKINFNDGLNVLVGKNAQGKTNLLESVFLCAIGKSPRVNKDKDLINWNEEHSKITLSLEKQSGKKTIEIFLFKNQNKAIKINGVQILRYSELLGEFNAIYFSPDDLKLVKESPDERRRFMDIDLSQFNKNYFYALSKYNKVLAQRNKLLKTSKNFESLKETVSVWNESLAKYGSYVILKRLELINKLNNYANITEQELTNNEENIKLSYTGLSGTEEEIKQNIILNLEKSLEKDYSLGYTTFGPHRDDFKIEVNNIDIRHFGSQGQQRTATLSLKLAELEVFKEYFNEYPILLLDDVLSELDNKRKNMLLNKTLNFQTILTCTEFDYDVNCTKFVINNGEISNIKQ